MRSRLPTPPPPPQQARSRETHESLLMAAEHVFADVGIAQATVAEICERAGVAVGTFYGRFPDKDALFQAWQERFIRRSRLAFERAFSDAMWEERSAAEIVRGWMQSRVLHARRNRRLLRALLQYVRSRPSAEFRHITTQLRAPQLQRIGALLDARPTEWAARERDRSLRLAVLMAEASIHSVVLFDEARSDELQLSDQSLVDALTAAISAALGLTT